MYWLSVFALIFTGVCLSPAVKWQVSWQYVCAVPSNEEPHTVEELPWRACLKRGVALLDDVTWVRRALAQRGARTHLLTTTVWVDTVHETIWNTHTHTLYMQRHVALMQLALALRVSVCAWSHLSAPLKGICVFNLPQEKVSERITQKPLFHTHARTHAHTHTHTFKQMP